MPLRRWQLSTFVKERLFVNVERRHLLGHKNLGTPPCVIGIASKGQQPVEDQFFGLQIDRLDFCPLDERAHFVNAAK